METKQGLTDLTLQDDDFENRDPLKGDGNPGPDAEGPGRVFKATLKTETRLKGMETKIVSIPPQGPHETPLKTETRLKGMETGRKCLPRGDRGSPYFENRDPLKGDGNYMSTGAIWR